MLKAFLVSLCVLDLTFATQGVLNSDLPFGFWFGGHGTTRRQVLYNRKRFAPSYNSPTIRDGSEPIGHIKGAGAHMQQRISRSLGRSGSISHDPSSGEIVQLLVDNLQNANMRKRNLILTRLLRDILGKAEQQGMPMADPVPEEAASRSRDLLEIGKRAPEMAEHVFQFQPQQQVHSNRLDYEDYVDNLLAAAYRKEMEDRMEAGEDFGLEHKRSL